MVEVESRHVPAIRILDASIRYNMVARLKTRRTGPYLIMERNEVSQWRTIAGSYRYKTRALQLRNSSGWHGPLVEPMWLSRLPLVSYPAVAGFSTPDIGGLCRLTHASAGWGLKARLDALLWGTWSWSSYSQRQRPPRWRSVPDTLRPGLVQYLIVQSGHTSTLCLKKSSHLQTLCNFVKS